MVEVAEAVDAAGMDPIVDAEASARHVPDDAPSMEEAEGGYRSEEARGRKRSVVLPVVQKVNGIKSGWRIWLRGGLARGTIMPFLVLVALTLGFVVKVAMDGPKEKQCMYWKDDRYIAVACDAKLPEEAKKIALDTFLLDNFRRITKPDTISERSVGKLWYLKYQKNFDYFTVRGVHPVHGKRLNRLSELIFRNEIASRRKENASEF